MIVYCEQRECIRNHGGECDSPTITLNHWEGDFDSTLDCLTYRGEDAIELPSVSLSDADFIVSDDEYCPHGDR
jgi:hypothetical protein